MNPLIDVWVSGGDLHQVTTYRDGQETPTEHARRHNDYVAQAKIDFPPNQP